MTFNATSEPTPSLEIKDLEEGYAQHQQHHRDVTPWLIEFRHIPGQLPAIYFTREIHSVDARNEIQRDKDGSDDGEDLHDLIGPDAYTGKIQFHQAGEHVAIAFDQIH